MKIPKRMISPARGGRGSRSIPKLLLQESVTYDATGSYLWMARFSYVNLSVSGYGDRSGPKLGALGELCAF